ncbi:uncharacterized protein LOC141590380 [Silene latifolia]|uniref:uncharacterized protein LOC141590380 n=1 Tax=Silene latifolia TaxID=37657 RepID=UPI003D77A986
MRIQWLGLRVSGRAVLPKHSFLMVLAMQRRLATIDKLNEKGLCIINRCILCKAACETHRHLFFRCPFAAEVWNGILVWMNVPARTMDMRFELRWIVGRRRKRHWKASWYMGCLNATVYSLWEERNSRIFRDVENTTDYIIRKIHHLVRVRLLFVTHPTYEDEIMENLNS